MHVTGTGEMVTCSSAQNSELFYGVLGGLGQFGIITRARIEVETAPEKVRWIRLIYTDFASFTRDQELLIQMDHKGFNYVEGSLLMDQSLISNWRSSFFSDSDLESIGKLAAEFGSIYCLEGAVYYNESDAPPSVVDQVINKQCSHLIMRARNSFCFLYHDKKTFACTQFDSSEDLMFAPQVVVLAHTHAKKVWGG